MQLTQNKQTKNLYKLISSNKKAQYDYFLSEQLEVGIILINNEIKQILNHGINIKESYVKIINSEVFLIGSNINGVQSSNRENLDSRDRKLLLSKKQIHKFEKFLQDQSTTLIVTKCYVNDYGLVKMELALGKGKKNYDKRQTIKERDLSRYAEY
jgi:SsrA-binding protein